MSEGAKLRSLQLAFVLSWSSGWIGAELIYPLASTSVVLLVRFSVAAVILTAIIGVLDLMHRRRSRRERDPLRDAALVQGRQSFARDAAAGLLAQAVWLWAVIEGQRYGLSPGANAILNALQPFVAATVTHFAQKKQLGTQFWLGLLLAFAGVVAVVFEQTQLGGAPLWVFVLPLISISSMTAAVLVQKRGDGVGARDDRDSSGVTGRRRAPAPKLRSLRNQTAVAAVAAALLMLVNPEIFIQWSWATAGLLLAIALIPTLAAYFLLWQLVEETSPHEASSLFLASPPTTMLLSWIILGTSITALQIVGAAAVLAGLIVANRKRKQTA
ncbi:MAG: DMT family transporter [Spirochaetales bacterium]